MRRSTMCADSDPPAVKGEGHVNDLGRCVPSVQGVQVVHCPQGGAAGMGHEPEQVEVVAQLAGREKQGSTGIETHCRNRFISVCMEVSDQSLTVQVIIHVKLDTQVKCGLDTYNKGNKNPLNIFLFIIYGLLNHLSVCVCLCVCVCMCVCLYLYIYLDIFFFKNN